MPSLPKKLVLGTRGSPLALVQANEVATLLQKKYPALKIEIKKIKTSGDQITDKPLADVGGKGLFVKELEEALLEGKIDFAVHSLKDLPGFLPDDLTLACYCKRLDPCDVWISKKYPSFENLPKGIRVGTSSPRRRAQLLFLKPTSLIEPIRGNIETRIQKMEGGKVDALLLAAAGLKRLQRERELAHPFSPNDFIPAVGQGIVAIETRKRDNSLITFLQTVLEDPETAIVARAERAFLQKLGGDCYTPLGAYAWVGSNYLRMIGFLASPDGKTLFRLERVGEKKNPELLGRELAETILMIGGREVLPATPPH